MVGDNHGAETQEKPQTPQNNGRQQAAQEKPQVSGTDWEKAVAERDEKIAAYETEEPPCRLPLLRQVVPPGRKPRPTFALWSSPAP